MTEFIVFCAAMLIAAALLILRPLLGESSIEPSGDQPAEPRATSAAVLFGLVLPLAALALYPLVSNFPWKSPASIAGAGGAGTAHAEGAGSLEEMIANLESRLESNPDDIEGWQMLGRTYLIGGQPDRAVAAYERAMSAAGDEGASFALDLAEALVLTEEPASIERGRAIIDEALAADPGNPKALWYSGVLAINAGDNDTARERWNTLLEQNPPPEIRELVVKQLARVGVEVPAAAMGSAPAVGAGAGPAMAMGGTVGAAGEPVGRTVRVSISIDPALRDKIGAGVPLFVSARQPGIPGPPLAAVRLTADELPMEVVLSDANSMIEGRNLSSVEDVEVIARVAFGGTAITESGDLVGRAIQTKGAAPEVGLLIDTVAP